MKKIVFLIIATLLVIGLVLPGCDGEVVTRPKIKIGVPYPFGTIQGTSMLSGAEMAASEINVAGVNVSNTLYDIQIIGRNDNEISAPSDAWHAVDYLISTAGAQFIIGGFRTEAVEPMIQGPLKSASPSVPFFITGSSTGDLLAGGLSGASVYPTGYGTPYYTFDAPNSGFYEYIFRVTPFNSGFLMGMVMTTFAQVAQQVQTAMGWTYDADAHAWPQKVRVAIVGENLTWAQPIIGGYTALVGGALGNYFGWDLTITRTFGDNPLPGVIDAALNDIEAAENQIILTCMSGPCGLTFGKRMGVLGINAIPVGINVEAQDLNYSINSAGGAEYEVTTATYAQGVNATPKTYQFLADYATYTGGAFPIYTAASYDMVYALKESIEGAGSLDKDAVCDYLRSHTRTGVSAFTAYYPEWDQVTHKIKSGKDLPALTEAQVDAIYTSAAHAPYASYNFTMGPFTTNDLVYGPGYATGLCIQWINGAQVAMYPKAGYDVVVNADVPYPVQTTLQSTLCGLYWSNTLEYPGTQAATIPAAYQTQWGIWFP